MGELREFPLQRAARRSSPTLEGRAGRGAVVTRLDAARAGRRLRGLQQTEWRVLVRFRLFGRVIKLLYAPA